MIRRRLDPSVGKPGGSNLSTQLIRTLYAQAPHATLHTPLCKVKHLLDGCQYLVSTDGQRLSAVVAYTQNTIECTWSLAGRSETLRNLIAQVQHRMEGLRFAPVMETGRRSWGQMLGLAVLGRYFRSYLPNPRRPRVAVPAGFEIIPLNPREQAEEACRLMNRAYPSLPDLISPESLRAMAETNYFYRRGWFFLRHHASGKHVGLAISGYDPDQEEGFIDWIQVAPRYRHRGLGACLAREAIRRLCDRSRFITAAGSLDAPFTLGVIFQECAFEQTRQWTILGQESREVGHRSPFFLPPKGLESSVDGAGGKQGPQLGSTR